MSLLDIIHFAPPLLVLGYGSFWYRARWFPPWLPLHQVQYTAAVATSSAAAFAVPRLGLCRHLRGSHPQAARVVHAVAAVADQHGCITIRVATQLARQPAVYVAYQLLFVVRQPAAGRRRLAGQVRTLYLCARFWDIAQCDVGIE
jgi:hypothetical protein